MIINNMKQNILRNIPYLEKDILLNSLIHTIHWSNKLPSPNPKQTYLSA